MRLIELKHTEETDNYHLFTITVETCSLFGNIKTETIDCVKEKNYSRSYMVDGGTRLFMKWVNIDDVISAILETESKYYKK